MFKTTFLNQKPMQMLLLLLLLVTIVGPWTYTLDGAPPPEFCEEPFFLTRDGRCGSLVSGISVLSLIGGGFIQLFFAIIGGSVALADRWFELMGSFFIVLLVLPLVSTVLGFRQEIGARLRIFHAISWVLGAALSLLAVVWLESSGSFRYWGLWLYVAASWFMTSNLLRTAIRSRMGKLAAS